jgi:glycogen operon protein
MLLHGDELGRTQQGNNNTYAQDSELSWVHWDQADEPLIEFTSALIELRRKHPTFRRRRFFTGRTVRTGPAGSERLNDIVWLHLDGRPMEDGDWASGAKAIGMYLNGHGIAGSDARGGTITDDHFLLYFNADGEATVTLPPSEYAESWDVYIDTAGTPDAVEVLKAGAEVTMKESSVLVLREYVPSTVEPDHSVAASLAALSGANPVEGTPAADRRHGTD